MDEPQLEITAIDWLKSIGWEYYHGPDISIDGDSPLRDSHRDGYLIPPLKEAFIRLNPHIPTQQRESIFADLLAILKQHSADLIEQNRTLYEQLIHGFPVTVQDEEGNRERERVFLIDFSSPSNNRFMVVNQLTLTGTKQPRRPDLLLYINGLPIAVIELKSPTAPKSSWEMLTDAYHQLQTYKAEIAPLFATNGMLVISDGLKARVGSLSAGLDRFMPWRAVKDETDRPHLEYELETLIYGLFDHKRLLDYLQNFILFQQDGRDQTYKIIAGYHQFHAVQNALKATIMASDPNRGDGKVGVVWHTQGSGKSLSMAFYVGKLLKTPEMGNPTIVVVTDRNDLDDQLFGTFAAAESLFNNTAPRQANNREALRRLLAEREAGGIIFTTVQKFSPEEMGGSHPQLNDRRNIVVISDEAHRSQYGLNARLNEQGIYTYGYAKHLRDALPNASFIGFTGTPIELQDRDTRQVFGEDISIYDIEDAVEDGATVPIYYEPRLAKLNLDDTALDDLSDQIDEIYTEGEAEEAEKQKANWSRLEKVVGAPNRIEIIANDIVTHFETRNQESPIEGKAMVVGMSRAICVDLYQAIVKLRPDWHDRDPRKGEIKIMMTGSASDPAHFQSHLYSKPIRKALENRFRDPDDPFKMVIVCDMWLTGFDAPSCHTLYIDKLMRGHNLMQAIARVNRVFKEKVGGVVVDYIGIGSELEKALHTYTNAKGRGEPTKNIEVAFSELCRYLEIVRGLFKKSATQGGFDLGDIRTKEGVQSVLLPAANYILGLRSEEGERDGKRRFLDALLGVNRALSLCATLDRVEPYQEEIAFYNRLARLVRKSSAHGERERQERSDALFEQIIQNAVQAEGIIDLYQYCNLDQPRIDILDEEFFDNVRASEQRDLALELLQQLITNQVRSNLKSNIVQERAFSDRLRETMARYNNRTIESAEAMEELIKMAKDLSNAVNEGERLGLKYDELAFYQALAQNDSALEEMGDEQLKSIAIEITEVLRRSVTVDWQKRESIRARLRIIVRRTLRKYGYPPDGEQTAMELILENTELLSDQWSSEQSAIV